MVLRNLFSLKRAFWLYFCLPAENGMFDSFVRRLECYILKSFVSTNRLYCFEINQTAQHPDVRVLLPYCPSLHRHSYPQPQPWRNTSAVTDESTTCKHLANVCSRNPPAIMQLSLTSYKIFMPPFRRGGL